MRVLVHRARTAATLFPKSKFFIDTESPCVLCPCPALALRTIQKDFAMFGGCTEGKRAAPVILVKDFGNSGQTPGHHPKTPPPQTPP